MFPNPKKNKLLYETGQMLKCKRQEKNLSLQQVAEYLKISTNYASEIERGLKNPSDDLIERIAEYYNIEIDGLFKSFYKVPRIIREKTEENEVLQKAILEIERRDDLSDRDKEEVYDDLYTALQYLLQERKGKRA